MRNRKGEIAPSSNAKFLGEDSEPISCATAGTKPDPAATINIAFSAPFALAFSRFQFPPAWDATAAARQPVPLFSTSSLTFGETDTAFAIQLRPTLLPNSTPIIESMNSTTDNDQSTTWQENRHLLLHSYTSWLQANPKPAMNQMTTSSGGTDAVDPPIALRRGKRRRSAISPVKDSRSIGPTITLENDLNDIFQPTTPSQRRSKKRARLSHPSVSTTGLTPAVRRASLATPRRRITAPPQTPPSTTIQVVQFTPYRQVLDERYKRRIRRNGLSEECNDYEADKRIKAELEKRVQAKDEELRKLREELEAVKAASAHDVPSAEEDTSSQRIDEVEAELAALRESFNSAAAAGNDDDFADINWDHVIVRKAGATLGPGSDGGDTIPIWEDDDVMTADVGINTNAQPECGPDVELLAMALDLEAAKHEKRKLFQDVRHQLPGSSTNPMPSFEFADSPSRPQQNFTTSLSSLPSPPKDFYRNLSATLKATTSRADDAELALYSLDTNLKSLGFEGSDGGAIIADIASQFRKARLELERAVPGETVTAFENAKVLPDIIARVKSLVRQLKDKEAEMKAMRDQQKTLKGNFEHAIMASDKSNRRVWDLENSIEAGAEEMLETRMKVQALEKESAEKDKNVSALITALEKYRQDVTRLEQLVTQLESEVVFKVQEAKDMASLEKEQQLLDLEAKVAAEERGRRAAETSAVERLAMIKDLEAKLEVAQRRAFDVQLQLNAVSASKEEEEFKLKKKLHERDEQAQAQLGALNTRISNLGTTLASANAEVEKLKVHKLKLEDRVRKEVELGERAVEVIKEELMKSLGKVNETKNSYVRGAKIRVANGELRDAEEEEGESGAEPMTPVSLVRFVDAEADDEHVQGSVELSRGKGRRGRSKGKHGKRDRRPDSGIGMGTLSEEDETDGVDELSDGVGEFSLDGDDEVDVDMMV